MSWHSLTLLAVEQAKVPASRANVPAVSPETLLTNGVSLVVSLAGIICVVMIITGGFRYVTSQGDSGAVTKAKNTILYAVIGLVVSIFAFAITQFVSNSVLNG